VAALVQLVLPAAPVLKVVEDLKAMTAKEDLRALRVHLDKQDLREIRATREIQAA
jgi:hypothetical protein